MATEPMSDFSREEIEDAFRTYFMVGPVYEDWIAWSRLFTDDAVYFDHYYGRFHGPSEIQQFLESTMMFGKHCYTSLVWHSIDGDRVVWKGLNTADHPVAGEPPFTFPSLQIIHYAGDGRWRSEEDWWIPSEMVAFAKGYWKACQQHDPDFPDQLSRRHWGDIEWARPADGHVARPSWLGRENEVPKIKRVEDMTFGERV
ncbi:MAG: nuclear transport factor 2 family protein [Acidimicrobiia bacterium]